MRSDTDPPQAAGTPDGADLVDLVADALEALEEGGEDALQALLARHPQHEETVRRRLSLLLDSGLDPQQAQSSPEAVPDVLGGFRLERPLGHGGMGVVWLAEEIALGRQVALKLVRPDQLLFPGARERFRREVQVIARLQHPGIVPVYSVGEERGLPYFAMEHVVGATLSEAIEALASAGTSGANGRALWEALPPDEDQADANATPPELFQGSWNEVCARIGAEVADALEHARRRGVVHRDVKPSNVMITRAGRVQLFDFGLSSREGDARLTRSGAVLGSLAYMPPEALVRSRTKDASATSVGTEETRQDVYGLGVTLYELLALALPFPVTNLIVLQSAIESGDARPLRSARPDVPADLAAVVGKAMDRDAGRRYATPGELAADLDRYLSRRPVLAQPPSLGLRARRWVERSPARAAALAILVLAPTLLFVRELSNKRIVEAKNETIRGQNSELVDANGALERSNLDLAETNAALERSGEDLKAALAEVRAQQEVTATSFAKALDAIDTMLTTVAEERLANVPGIQDLRRDLLGEALGLYDWFLDQDHASEELRREVARVARKAGDFSGFLADIEASTESLNRSEELLQELVEADPVDLEAKIALSDTLQRRALTERLQGELRTSVETAREGLAILEAIDLRSANEIGRRTGTLARSGLLTELSQTREMLGERDEALHDMEEAVDLLRALVQDGSTEVTVRYDLSRALDLLAGLRGRRAALGLGPGTAVEQFELAREELLESRDLAEAMLDADPAFAQARFRLARILVNSAAVESALGEVEHARELSDESVEQLEQLVRDNPEVPQYTIDLAVALENRAAMHLAEGRHDQGTEVCRRILALLEPLESSAQSNLQMFRCLATGRAHLGATAIEAGELERGLELAGAGFVSLDRGLAISPLHPMLNAQKTNMRRVLEQVLVTAGHGERFLDLEAARLLARPNPTTLGRFAADARELLETVAPERREVVLATTAGALAAALVSQDLDLFALVDLEDGARLLDVEGVAERIETALGEF